MNSATFGCWGCFQFSGIGLFLTLCNVCTVYNLLQCVYAGQILCFDKCVIGVTQCLGRDLQVGYQGVGFLPS